MPSQEFTDPLEWLNTVKVTAEEFNEQVFANLTWLFEKNQAVAQKGGIADITTTNTTAPTTSVYNEVIDLTLIKRQNTAIKFDVTMQTIHSANAGYVKFDVLVDGAYFLSTGTDTPATNGAFYQQFPAANRAFSLHGTRFVFDLEEGLHRFQLVWWVSTGTGSINITNTMLQASVEEYGIPDRQ